MDFGTILFLVIGGVLLLVVLFLPLMTRSSTNAQPDIDEERENAYRRGLLIGSLMEEMNEIQKENQGRRME